MNRRVTPQTGRNARRGFTLIEMLLVIVIIGILAALLLPAIQSATTTARNAAVRAEIAQLETAIANFKAAYGHEPPSRITLYEASGAWDPATQAKIRAIWPNFRFDMARDLNGDHNRSGVFDLAGAACLAFFLGGMPCSYGTGADSQPGVAGTDDDGDGVVDNVSEMYWTGSDDTVQNFTSGFSKDPSNPFVVTPGQSVLGPFFEFAPSRLRLDSNKLYYYLDSLPGQTTAYLYLSSNEGQGYQPATGEIVYLISPNTYHKPKSFQIISPGADGQYGIGGVFDPSQTNSALTDPRDRDNLTNLATGRLAP